MGLRAKRRGRPRKVGRPPAHGYARVCISVDPITLKMLKRHSAGRLDGVSGLVREEMGKWAKAKDAHDEAERRLKDATLQGVGNS